MGIPLRRPDHFVLHFLPLLAPFSLPLPLPMRLPERPCVGHGFVESGTPPFVASPTDGTDRAIAVMPTVTAAGMRLLMRPSRNRSRLRMRPNVEATVLLLTRYNV